MLSSIYSRVCHMSLNSAQNAVDGCLYENGFSTRNYRPKYVSHKFKVTIFVSAIPTTITAVLSASFIRMQFSFSVALTFRRIPIPLPVVSSVEIQKHLQSTGVTYKISSSASSATTDAALQRKRSEMNLRRTGSRLTIAHSISTTRELPALRCREQRYLME